MKVLIVDNNPTTFTIEIPKNLQSLNVNPWCSWRLIFSARAFLRATPAVFYMPCANIVMGMNIPFVVFSH